MICLSIITVLSIAVAAIIFTHRHDTPDNARSYKRKFDNVFRISHTIFGIGCGVIMLGCFIKPSLMIPNMDTKSKQVNSPSYRNEIIALLQDDIWENMTNDDKLDTLQKIANMEQYYLGIPYEIQICADHMQENTLGCYAHAKHQIMINIDSLNSDSSWELLDTICHECYHSYQHCLVDLASSVDNDYKNLLAFRRAHHYAEEWLNYKDGSDNYEEYSEQYLESDAREYAEWAVDAYYNEMQEYLESYIEY